MFKWKAGIPGKEGTDWDGGVYTVSMEFSEEYPARPPRCKFLVLSGAVIVVVIATEHHALIKVSSFVVVFL
jgi:hypothetical protein